MIRALAMALLLAGPALAQEPPASPETAALVDDLIVTLDAVLADLDASIAELELAAAEAPGDAMLARLLTDYRAERDDLAARRAELVALRSPPQ